MNLKQEYGKTKVRVVKVVDLPPEASAPGLKKQKMIELTCSVLLSGPAFSSSYSSADNLLVVPTDTVKNTIYLLAKTEPISDLEEFAFAISAHFITKYPHVDGVHTNLVSHDWSRINTTTYEPVLQGDSGSKIGNDTKPHPHAFYRGGQHIRYCESFALRKSGNMQIDLTSGVKGYEIVKTTGSSFVDFHQCELTTLPPMAERVFSTTVDAKWSFARRTESLAAQRKAAKTDYSDIYLTVLQITLDYFCNHDSPSVQNTVYRTGQRVLAEIPAIQSVTFSLPNIHYFMYDLQRFGVPNRIGDGSAILYPVADPAGLITATMTRIDAKL